MSLGKVFRGILVETAWVTPSAGFWLGFALLALGSPIWAFAPLHCIWGLPLLTVIWRVILCRSRFRTTSKAMICVSLVTLLLKAYFYVPSLLFGLALSVGTGLRWLGRKLAPPFARILTADPWGVDMLICLVLLLTVILNVTVSGRIMLLVSALVALMAIQLLVARAMRWAFDPSSNLESLVHRSLISSIVLGVIGEFVKGLGESRSRRPDEGNLFGHLLRSNARSDKDGLISLGEILVDVATRRGDVGPPSKPRLLVLLV